MKTPSKPHREDGPLRRERFLSASPTSETAREKAILRMLLAQDGSTTQLLETIGGSPVHVRILDQREVEDLPTQVGGFLSGNRYLRRLAALEAFGEVVVDSLSYIALDVLPPPVVQELREGVSPIGHLLSHTWTRREFRYGDTQMFDELWSAVGLPDATASRSCCIFTPRSTCVVLAETFRRGVLKLFEERVA